MADLEARPKKRPATVRFLLKSPVERSTGLLFGLGRLRFGLGRGGVFAVTSAQFAFIATVDAWLLASASPDIAELVAATRLSRRQIERRCNALYGAPPKLLARRHRALRAAAALAAGARSVDGFYDQSHLIRELKQFTGLTPRRIRDDPSLLSHLDHRTPTAGA